MGKWDVIIEEMFREDDFLLLEAKDRIIDRLPSLDDSQKAEMKAFFAKRPSLESKFDWNRPDTITWDAFRSIAGDYDEPIDPDTVPEFSDKRDEGQGVVSYEVQDDRNGQMAVRRIVDTHWGSDCNPWCLIAKRPWGPGAEPDLREAFGLWRRYSALPKRIAFKDGRLLAFMATDGKRRKSGTFLRLGNNIVFGPLWSAMALDENGVPTDDAEAVKRDSEEFWSQNGEWKDRIEETDAWGDWIESLNWMMSAIENGNDFEAVFNNVIKHCKESPTEEKRIIAAFLETLRSDGLLGTYSYKQADASPSEEWWDRLDRSYSSIHNLLCNAR